MDVFLIQDTDVHRKIFGSRMLTQFEVGGGGGKGWGCLRGDPKTYGLRFLPYPLV